MAENTTAPKVETPTTPDATTQNEPKKQEGAKTPIVLNKEPKKKTNENKNKEPKKIYTVAQLHKMNREDFLKTQKEIESGKAKAVNK